MPLTSCRSPTMTKSPTAPVLSRCLEDGGGKGVISEKSEPKARDGGC